MLSESEQPPNLEPSAESAATDKSSERPRETESSAAVGGLKVGTIVCEKYRIESILGEGAMGVVAACTHVELGERVALKFLHATSSVATEEFRLRFRREARISARLKNEHITRVVDVGVWRGIVPFMVMEHLDGVDLRSLIREHKRLAPEVAVDYAIQICEGLAEAHALNIIHRDLKPANLFLVARPDGSELVKILDFGISKWTSSTESLDELTQTGTVLGSPKYMAPEQLFGSSDVDARADVWSIGVVLYELLTGRPPIDLPSYGQVMSELAGTNPPRSICEQVSEVNEELERVIFRCLERSVDARTQDVAALAGALLSAIGSPDSEAVSARIGATLGARGVRERLTSTSGAMRSAMAGDTRNSSGSHPVASSISSLRASTSAPRVAPPNLHPSTSSPNPPTREVSGELEVAPSAKRGSHAGVTVLFAVLVIAAAVVCFVLLH